MPFLAARFLLVVRHHIFEESIIRWGGRKAAEISNRDKGMSGGHGVRRTNRQNNREPRTLPWQPQAGRMRRIDSPIGPVEVERNHQPRVHKNHIPQGIHLHLMRLRKHRIAVVQEGKIIRLVHLNHGKVHQVLDRTLSMHRRSGAVVRKLNPNEAPLCMHRDLYRQALIPGGA